MNKQLMTMLRNGEGRHLTKAERAMLREEARSLEARLVCSEELEAKEASIVEATVRESLQTYPDFEQKHKEAKLRGTRDVALVVRYVALAIVRQDPGYLDDALLTWFATIVQGLGFTSNFLSDSYKILERQVAAELTPASAALAAPFFAQVTNRLGAARAA